MDILQEIRDHLLLMDGAMGTVLQKNGLKPGELPERLNLTRPGLIEKVHLAYLEAGSRLISTNTFGANRLKMAPDELKASVESAVRIARGACEKCALPGLKYVALDIGPSGRLLKPYGDLSFEEAVSVFGETIRIGAGAGADLVFIETMSDIYETRAALIAAKENCRLPVFVSNAYGEDGRLLTGASPEAVIAMLEAMGADAIGVNCSLGPDKLAPVFKTYLEQASVPLIFKPNAGLPRIEKGRTVYSLSPADFAKSVLEQAKGGARLIGGCCGTEPEHIRLLSEGMGDIRPLPLRPRHLSRAASGIRAVFFGKEPVLIGERLNPNSKKAVKEAIVNGDTEYLLKEAIAQKEEGAQVLDVNAGVPGIDEAAVLRHLTEAVQAVSDLPLALDSADPDALEAALRTANGKPIINSLSGKEESMRRIFPLMKKYGAMAVALTLDESGIPADAEGRLLIARKIIKKAEEYGIGREELLFDPLTLTVSADPSAPEVTLKALELISREPGCKTVLGVSNISFGLPERDRVSAAFFLLALERGLTAAIMNPASLEMQTALHSFRLLSGRDPGCKAYLDYSAANPSSTVKYASGASESPEGAFTGLEEAILKGFKDQAASMTRRLLAEKGPLSLISEEVVPALDKVGRGFEAKTVFLPQLLLSAEAAGAAVDVIKEYLPAGTKKEGRRFVLATVRGDIHDIGKNIVKLLLENYGFDVQDLGRDVPPETVLKAVLSEKIKLVGLSALMTTTLPAMEETIRLLHEKAPFCRIVVGGAVLTAEYAAAIGADHYAKDAMETVRWAEAESQ